MKEFYTESDAGAVKIGINGKFTILIPNGYGDGDVCVLVTEKDEPGTEQAKGEFFTSIEGDEINIYAYDCKGYRGDEIVTTLRGRYGIYTDSEEKDGEIIGGLVVFEKWKD